MLPIIMHASWLVAATVVIHSLGLSMLLRNLVNIYTPEPLRFWPISWFLIRIAWLLLLIHLLEIGVWGVFYWWKDCLPDRESALYFAGVTYTTLGYGDLVLPPQWRLLGPIEGLTGILMCGLSTGTFFAVASRILQHHSAEKT